MKNPYVERKDEAAIISTGLLTAAVVATICMVVLFLIMPVQAWLNDHNVSISMSVLADVWLQQFKGYWHFSHDAPASAGNAFLRVVRWYSIQHELTWRVVALIVGPLVGLIVSRRYLEQRLEPEVQAKHVRGRRYWRGSAARTRLRSLLSKDARKNQGCELTDGISMSSEITDKSMLISGQQGAGKTQLYRFFIDQNVAKGHWVLIHDVKGELTAGFPQGFVLLAPHDRRSYAWDVDQDVRGEIAAQELASQLIPESQDPTWSNGARTVLTGLIVALQRRCDDQGTKLRWGWRDLYEVSVLPAHELKGLLGNHPAAELIQLDDDGNAGRTTFGILITFWAATLSLLRPLMMAWGDHPPERRFSLRAWVNGGVADTQRTVILQSCAELKQLSASWIACAINALARICVDARMPENPKRRMVFALDELPQLEKLGGVRTLLSVGRSKGAICILGVQDIAQLQLLYGADEARVWQSLLNVKIIGRHVAGPAANSICDELIGKAEVAFQTETITDGRDGRSIATRWEQIERLVVRPEQLEEELGFISTVDGQRVRALVLGFGDVYRLDWFPSFWPVQREAVEPATWMAD